VPSSIHDGGLLVRYGDSEPSGATRGEARKQGLKAPSSPRRARIVLHAYSAGSHGGPSEGTPRFASAANRGRFASAANRGPGARFPFPGRIGKRTIRMISRSRFRPNPSRETEIPSLFPGQIGNQGEWELGISGSGGRFRWAPGWPSLDLEVQSHGMPHWQSPCWCPSIDYPSGPA
jgi:hypothetical protein